MSGILGKKLGMTGLFTETGEYVPCTVIEAGPCVVTQVKHRDTDGYEAVQLGFGVIADRLVNKPQAGKFAAIGTKPFRTLKEFRSFDTASMKPGDEVNVSMFKEGEKVHVVSTSKGRGFQGVVKRHHFGGVGQSSHGQSDRQRHPGSIGGSSFPSRVFKGTRMAGRMGHEQITTRNLRIMRVIPESNLIVVRGSFAGAKNELVQILKP